MSILSIVLVMWLAIATALTLAWILLITIRNHFGSLSNLLQILIRKYLNP